MFRGKGSPTFPLKTFPPGDKMKNDIGAIHCKADFEMVITEYMFNRRDCQDAVKDILTTKIGITCDNNGYIMKISYKDETICKLCWFDFGFIILEKDISPKFVVVMQLITVAVDEFSLKVKTDLDFLSEVLEDDLSKLFKPKVSSSDDEIPEASHPDDIAIGSKEDEVVVGEITAEDLEREAAGLLKDIEEESSSDDWI